MHSLTRNLSDMALHKYLDENNTDELGEYIASVIKDDGPDALNVIAISKVNNDVRDIVKDLVTSSYVDENRLASQIAKVIISDIEKYVDNHLAEFGKYTLSDYSPIPCSTAEFFNLIGLLKDVSLLGRKLLESGPQFNAPKQGTELIGDQASIKSAQSKSKHSIKSLSDEDATSEDLLAALIESSSSDDFLVLSSSLASIPVKDMILAGLIYIKCHECFTLSHDIQGVAIVLRRTKFIILNILAPRNQMELIAKLLTAIGRYSEMNYVFDLFRDRNQFEILLSKGVEKSPELRIALFNYVKKNPEFYQLVTLNFSMFSEIAESLEASAFKRLDRAIKCKKNELQEYHRRTSIVKTSSKSSPTKRLYSKESLNLSLTELMDAADCFSKAGCYKRSNKCQYKAKLIALQLALLSGDEILDVLDVNQPDLVNFIIELELFAEAKIVADAYECHFAWHKALFKNVVMLGKINYLNDFSSKCDLSPSLIHEVVSLYKQYLSNNQLERSKSIQMAIGMKAILARLPNIEHRCRVFIQLNFEDSKEELLKDEAVRAYLKDLDLA